MVAIDIDDTINNFSEILKNLNVNYEEYSYLKKEIFNQYLELVKKKEYPKSRYYDDYYGFVKSIHQKCYMNTTTRPDAVKFIQWLSNNGWKVLILTYRDLREILDDTKKWLADNRIPYDYLFSVDNKITFCKLWGIGYLIDDSPINVFIAPDFDIKTFYPINDETKEYETIAYGFNCFDELYSKFEGIV